MHVDAADKIAMTGETTYLAGPDTPARFVFVTAFRTTAGRPPFRAAEARNAGLPALVSQVIDVAAILPLRHPLVVMATAAPTPDAIRVADVEARNLVVPAEVDDLPRALVTQIPDAPFGSQGIAIAGAAELLPPPGTFDAPGHLCGDGAVHLVQPPLLGANAAAGDDQAFPCTGGDGALVYLSEIDRRLGASGHRRLDFRPDGDMQLVADAVPDDLAGRWLREPFRSRQHDGFATAPHRQDDPFAIERHRLSGPHQRIEPLVLIGIADILAARLAQLARRVYIRKESVANHLRRLGMQSEAAFGEFLQRIAIGPLAVLGHGDLECIAADAPDLPGLDLSVTDDPRRLP